MKKQITRISILQSSKIATVLYFLVGFIYTLIGIPMTNIWRQANSGHGRCISFHAASDGDFRLFMFRHLRRALQPSSEIAEWLRIRSD
jgi:hypothetical protein